MELSRRGCVLMLIDMQRAFCSLDGSMAAQGRDIGTMRAAMLAGSRLAAAARASGVPVLWTRMQFAPDYSDGGLLVHELRPNLKAIGALRRGTPDVDIAPEAGWREGDAVLDKARYSAFVGTKLDAWLREHAIERALVGGVSTSMCVDSTVRGLSQRDTATFVVREACGDFDAARHEAALSAMAFGFARVIGMDDALAALAGPGREF